MKGNESAFELKLKKLTEGSGPVPQRWVKYEVSFTTTGSLLAKYVHAEYQDINLQRRRNHFDDVPFTEEQLLAYCCWCIKQRIDYVNNEKPEWSFADRKAFPAFISVICQNIGKVEDAESGLILVPVFGELFNFSKISKIGQTVATETSHFDVEDANEISRILKSIDGYHYAEGYLRDKTGVADFMLMQVIGTEVLSIRTKSHPVYALMSSVVGTKLVAASLNPMVKYADVNTLEILLDEVTSIG